jgi:hypothetical protein
VGDGHQVQGIEPAVPRAGPDHGIIPRLIWRCEVPAEDAFRPTLRLSVP